MNCLSIAAAALRLASIDEDHQRFEPGLFVETGCLVEAGISRRDGEFVGDLGLKLRPLGNRGPWLRAGAEADHTRETTYYRRPSTGTIGQPVYSVTTLDRRWHVRPRVSVGFDMPVVERFFVAAEAEATRGGKLLLSVGRKF